MQSPAMLDNNTDNVQNIDSTSGDEESQANYNNDGWIRLSTGPLGQVQDNALDRNTDNTQNQDTAMGDEEGHRTTKNQDNAGLDKFTDNVQDPGKPIGDEEAKQRKCCRNGCIIS